MPSPTRQEAAAALAAALGAATSARHPTGSIAVLLAVAAGHDFAEEIAAATGITSHNIVGSVRRLTGRDRWCRRTLRLRPGLSEPLLSRCRHPHVSGAFQLSLTPAGTALVDRLLHALGALRGVARGGNSPSGERIPEYSIGDSGNRGGSEEGDAPAGMAAPWLALPRPAERLRRSGRMPVAFAMLPLGQTILSAAVRSRKIRHTDLALWLALLNRANRQSGRAVADEAALAEELGSTERNVRAGLRRLSRARLAVASYRHPGEWLFHPDLIGIGGMERRAKAAQEFADSIGTHWAPPPRRSAPLTKAQRQLEELQQLQQAGQRGDEGQAMELPQLALPPDPEAAAAMEGWG